MGISKTILRFWLPVSILVLIALFIASALAFLVFWREGGTWGIPVIEAAIVFFAVGFILIKLIISVARQAKRYWIE
jgi:hypothetical protein